MWDNVLLSNFKLESRTLSQYTLWSTTGKQCSWWATRYQLDIRVVGHHWQHVAFGGGPLRCCLQGRIQDLKKEGGAGGSGPQQFFCQFRIGLLFKEFDAKRGGCAPPSGSAPGLGYCRLPGNLTLRSELCTKKYCNIAYFH